jgi:Flp pilus assembly protein TadD
MNMDESFPVLTGDDFEPDRRIDFMHSSVISGADAAAAGVSSPMKESSIQHQVTPESSASRQKSPMQSPTYTPPPMRVRNKHIAKAVPARVVFDHESVNFKAMMQQSALLKEQASKTTRYDSPARRPYSRTQNNMAISFHDSPGSSRNGDAMSTRSPPDSPKNTTIISSTGVEQVSGSLPKGYLMSDEMSGARTPSPRRYRSNSTGPVDVDQGRFLEAEHNLKAIHQMAAEHLAHGEYEEALEVFEEILRGQRERYGDRHYRVGTALHNIGIVHLKNKRYDKAIKVCREAVRVRKEALVPNHPDVAVSLAQLGVAHLECQQHRESLIAFREALQIRREFLGSKHPKVGKVCRIFWF